MCFSHVWFIAQSSAVMAAVSLLLPCPDGRPCVGSESAVFGQAPSQRPRGDDPAAADLDSIEVSNLLWTAREANRHGRYDEAGRQARAVTRRGGVSPDVLCAAWMNVFFAAHRTGDQAAVTSALRSFDESATRLPANDPVLLEMGEGRRQECVRRRPRARDRTRISMGIQQRGSSTSLAYPRKGRRHPAAGLRARSAFSTTWNGRNQVSARRKRSCLDICRCRDEPPRLRAAGRNDAK